LQVVCVPVEVSIMISDATVLHNSHLRVCLCYQSRSWFWNIPF
jgi:hypothetical protein